MLEERLSSEEERACWSLRLVPDAEGEVRGLRASFISRSLGRGPRTPRQDGVPQRQTWMFFVEKGLVRKVSICAA